MLTANLTSFTKILPKELWLKITTYMSTKDIFNLKQVSKASLELIKELPLDLSISAGTLKLWRQKQRSGHAALLRVLTGHKIKQCTIHGGNIRNCHLTITHDLFWSQIPKGCLKTEDLTIENLETLTPTTFQTCLASCQDLKNLQLKRSTFKGTTYFWPLYAASLSLEILILHRCKISELAPALQILPHLKILILIACDISSTELTYLEPQIQKINITREDIVSIARSLGFTLSS